MIDSINKAYRNSKSFRYSIWIINSLLIDILFFITTIYWALFSKSWRLVFSFGLFYGVRGILQVIIIFINNYRTFFNYLFRVISFENIQGFLQSLIATFVLMISFILDIVVCLFYVRMSSKKKKNHGWFIIAF